MNIKKPDSKSRTSINDNSFNFKKNKKNQKEFSVPFKNEKLEEISGVN